MVENRTGRCLLKYTNTKSLHCRRSDSYRRRQAQRKKLKRGLMAEDLLEF